MNNSNSGATTGGITFFGLLGIVFIVLKLLHVIEWSWFWVLAPLWMPFALVLLLVLLYFLFIKWLIHR